MRLNLEKIDLLNNGSGGLEISINGLNGDPSGSHPDGSRTSVFLENYKGKILCHIWTNNQNDCQTIELN